MVKIDSSVGLLLDEDEFFVGVDSFLSPGIVVTYNGVSLPTTGIILSSKVISDLSRSSIDYEGDD